MSEYTYGYGSYIESYKKNDWKSGVGIRKKRSTNHDEMMKYLNLEKYSEERNRFDVEYEVSLDEPLTLYQAGMRWWISTERVKDWRVDSIEFSEDVKLSEERVEYPNERSTFFGDYCDEDCVLYTFQDNDSSLNYLAMYSFEDRKLVVPEKSDKVIRDAKIYKGKIYYYTEIVDEIAYKQMQDGQEQIVKKNAPVGICLNRMNTDGSGKEIIFEYQYPAANQETPDSRLYYPMLIYEISGNEIIADVYVIDEDDMSKLHQVYRMKIDGSGLKWIGQIPAES